MLRLCTVVRSWPCPRLKNGRRARGRRRVPGPARGTPAEVAGKRAACAGRRALPVDAVPCYALQCVVEGIAQALPVTRVSRTAFMTRRRLSC